jgi:hypothetical protein
MGSIEVSVPHDYVKLGHFGRVVPRFTSWAGWALRGIVAWPIPLAGLHRLRFSAVFACLVSSPLVFLSSCSALSSRFCPSGTMASADSCRFSRALLPGLPTELASPAGLPGLSRRQAQRSEPCRSLMPHVPGGYERYLSFHLPAPSTPDSLRQQELYLGLQARSTIGNLI